MFVQSEKLQANQNGKEYIPILLECWTQVVWTEVQHLEFENDWWKGLSTLKI